MNLGEDKTAQVITDESQSGPNAEERERAAVVAYIERGIMEIVARFGNSNLVLVPRDDVLRVLDRARAGKHLPSIARDTK